MDAGTEAGMDKESPFRLVTSRRGPPGRPFGWEICKGDASIEVARSTETFRSRHEAITDGERTLQALNKSAGVFAGHE
jgi:hypothetical protein